MNRARKLGLWAGSLALTCAVAEIALRVALFSDARWIGEHAWRLRRADLFFDPSSDDDYWKLRHVFGSSAGTATGESPARLLNAEVGWVAEGIDPITLSNTAAPAADDARRVVLLYGCSFSRCMTPSSECFEGLLASSPLGDRFVLVNYGVAGFGLDQTGLMVNATLARFAAAKPIVIVGLLVDDDIDRCVLRLRGSPKPRFVLRGGQLVRESERVPTLERFLSERPLAATSYAWRGFARASGLSHDDELEREKRELGAALIASVCAQLRAADVEFFFVLYSGAETLGAGPPQWREKLALESLRTANAHFVATRVPLEKFAREHGGDVTDLFLHDGDSDGHYSALGNRIAFSALLAGLEGRFDD